MGEIVYYGMRWGQKLWRSVFRFLDWSQWITKRFFFDSKHDFLLIFTFLIAPHQIRPSILPRFLKISKQNIQKH